MNTRTSSAKLAFMIMGAIFLIVGLGMLVGALISDIKSFWIFGLTFGPLGLCFLLAGLLMRPALK